MIKLLRTHVEQERGLLEEYQQAADDTDSKALAYLVNLLIEDERRHHRLFIELAKSLVSEAELSQAELAVPRLDFRRADQAALLDVTDRLLAHEKGRRARVEAIATGLEHDGGHHTVGPARRHHAARHR